jgi:hypothetical protein
MTLRNSVLALASLTALAACDVPGAPDEVLYGVVVGTNFKQNPDQTGPDPIFASATAVTLETTIEVVDDTNSGVTVSVPAQQGLIEQIKKNLEARHYTVTLRAPGDAVPPAGTLRMGAYALFGSVNVFYSSYWCSYYYYYYCTPTTSYAGSYDYGTLLIEAITGTSFYNPGLPPVAANTTMVWSSASYGVFAGSSTISPTSPGYPKALGAIDQAFAQSPYFTRAP